MDISPETLPLYMVKDVGFDHRLFEMDQKHEHEREHDGIDTFWSMIYIARLAPQVREYLADNEIRVSSIEVVPTNCDLDAGTIDVLLCAQWRQDTSEHTYPAQALWISLNVDGTLTDERNDPPITYSSAMTSHIHELLLHTALNSHFTL
ncbi:hypothetical protein H7Y40_00130 [Pedobacter sp.]|nr:hypothetical protein [Candidatus Saccharibacteria bacterium]